MAAAELPVCLVGVIGGSGMYEMEGMDDVHEVDIAMTPFGSPSSAFVVGTLHGVQVAFLARHAAGHTILPEELPSRANIFAMKLLGVKWIISVSACGSLKEEIEPGHIAIPDGLFDRTSGRPQTFFGNGVVAHVSLADPFCPVLSKVLHAAVAEAIDGTDKKVHEGGALVSINGPRFSTRTESKVFRSWGLDLVNMTTFPEAPLAREAEIAYVRARVRAGRHAGGRACGCLWCLLCWCFHVSSFRGAFVPPPWAPVGRKHHSRAVVPVLTCIESNCDPSNAGMP